MSGVYISLNQGWTYFKNIYKSEGKKKIKRVTDAWKSLLFSTLNDFSFDPIVLSTTKRSDLIVVMSWIIYVVNIMKQGIFLQITF
jgi:hypothetical protein